MSPQCVRSRSSISESIGTPVRSIRGDRGHVPAAEQRLPESVGAGQDPRQHPLQQRPERVDVGLAVIQDAAAIAVVHGPPPITSARSSVFCSAVIDGMPWWDRAPSRPRPAG